MLIKVRGLERSAVSHPHLPETESCVSSALRGAFKQTKFLVPKLMTYFAGLLPQDQPMLYPKLPFCRVLIFACAQNTYGLFELLTLFLRRVSLGRQKMTTGKIIANSQFLQLKSMYLITILAIIIKYRINTV